MCTQFYFILEIIGTWTACLCHHGVGFKYNLRKNKKGGEKRGKIFFKKKRGKLGSYDGGFFISHNYHLPLLQFYKNFCAKLENIIWKPTEGTSLLRTMSC